MLLLLNVLAYAGLVPAGSTFARNRRSTPPPEIYHVVTTALCARLHDRVRPAVAMILQNDATIGKSPPLFKTYHARRSPRATEASPATRSTINRRRRIWRYSRCRIW